MRQMRIAALGLAVLMTVFWGCERKVTEEVTKIVAADGAAEYIGSSACSACHAAKYASFRNTGHPYKLNEAEDVAAGNYYPYTDVPNPPSGVNWADVDKVIGGFRWKARFIRPSGAIITGSAVQYNVADGSWSAYHDGEDKPYDCGPCHMTAYRDTGNQEGHDSLIGTWAYNGIQCEECHGAGSLHAATPYDIGMKIDRSNEGCGKCHIRGDVDKIPASGGFVRHHEQWNEMFTTKHQAIKCVDCHDVHYGLHPLSPDRDMAIKLKCENCHKEETESFLASSIPHAGSSSGPGCIDCHMPKAAKSAIATGPYVGDVTSHQFRINTDADAEFITDGYANGYLTLEYTCLQCHSSKDKAWAATYANSVHATTPATSGYVGSEACSACHPTLYASFRKTGHPYKLNEASDVQAGNYYPFTDVPNPPAGVDWTGVDKVIGGFWWKARFIRPSGAIITGSAVQYNLVDSSWSAYHDGEDKPYACGPCHMTDYEPIGNQEGHDSLIGTWAFNGIQCEECHGPGEKHIADAYNVDMKIDRSSEGCGKCHIRGDIGKIPASGNFVKHHEQWNEMSASKHASLQCVDCHDPHIGLHPDNPDRSSAIKLACEQCHMKETQSFQATTIIKHLNAGGPTCLDCHMPKGAKSAVAADTYVGDITSHQWKINIDPTAEYITNDNANGYLTVEYTCLKCHDTETKGWAAANAANAHGPEPVSEEEPAALTIR